MSISKKKQKNKIVLVRNKSYSKNETIHNNLILNSAYHINISIEI